MRPLIVPGPLLLGSFAPPNGGFSNPDVWLMLWTQLTARLVQCWSSYSIHFSAGAATTTMRVYVAAIAAQRDSDDVPLGRYLLLSSFMCGAKCLRPVRSPSFPSWDLSVVLKGLLESPFEPLESAPVKILTLNVTHCWHWPHQACGRFAGSVCQRVLHRVCSGSD